MHARICSIGEQYVRPSDEPALKLTIDLQTTVSSYDAWRQTPRCIAVIIATKHSLKSSCVAGSFFSHFG